MVGLPILNIIGPKIGNQPTYLTKLIYYVLIPLLIIKYIFRQPLSNFGVQIGNWRLGLIIFVTYMIGIILITPYAEKQGLLEYYKRENSEQREKWRNYDPISLMAWEFLWRGYGIFGLMQFYSPLIANLLQVIPFTLMHYGKPTIEFWSCLPIGLIFGQIAIKTQSFLYMGLIHAFQQFWVFYKLGNLDQMIQYY
jgi:membrane protease YdiL (CAAX protease family)